MGAGFIHLADKYKAMHFVQCVDVILIPMVLSQCFTFDGDKPLFFDE